MKEIDQNLPHDSEMKLYFADVTIEKALAQLFYDNLKNFSQTNFSQKPTP